VHTCIYTINSTLSDFGSCTTGHSSFAECLRHSAKTILHSAKNTRRTVHRQQPFCRVLFVGHSAKNLPSAIDTRQRKVTVTAPSDGDGSFAECLLWHSAKRQILPSVCYHGPRQRRLQWAPPPVPVPRAPVGTRQRRLLCRVSSGLALGKESSSGPL
jgi:hypothetical protein